jgi:hypothetical protein
MASSVWPNLRKIRIFRNSIDLSSTYVTAIFSNHPPFRPSQSYVHPHVTQVVKWNIYFLLLITILIKFRSFEHQADLKLNEMVLSW